VDILYKKVAIERQTWAWITVTKITTVSLQSDCDWNWTETMPVAVNRNSFVRFI